MAHPTLQSRFLNFISWIRPDPDKAEDIRKQRDDVKARIKAKAEDDGLMVQSTPASGSFAKGTGLRRHMLGGAEHEGQDVDCPFVLVGKDKDGDPLTGLLPKFEGYARACYPETEVELTKSSVKLKFASSAVSYDLVPMLAVEGVDDEQILLRAGGERRRTSIQKHVDFVRVRTQRSREPKGAVCFNDCVRLAKWWREFRVASGTIITEVPSFLVDLLCAKAFDEASVRNAYADTLITWFDQISMLAARRSDVLFRDYGPRALEPEASGLWRVIDPVNSKNNVVPGSWTGIHIDEFRDWAASARDRLQQAIAFDMRGRHEDAVALVVEVFGSAFKNHSEE